MPDFFIVFLLAVVLLIIGMSVLRFFDRAKETTASHRGIIGRLDRIERRLDER